MNERQIIKEEKPVEIELNQEFFKFNFTMFRKKLIDSMERENMTIDDLSEKSGIPKKRIDRYFRKNVKPSVEEFCYLYSALNVTADYLIGNTDDPKEEIENPRDYFLERNQVRILA